MNDISFTEALGIVPGITAIIGGGGKTSLMNRLAAELSAAGSRAIICTSTHIWRPADLPVLENAAEADIAAALMEHSVVCVGEREGEKLIAPKLPIARLNGLAPYVIAEADGSKGLPLKAHGKNEPVIPPGSKVIYVVGADGIGRTIYEAAHRPELYARRLGADVGHVVTPKDAATMVDYGDTVLFNKADRPEDVENGRAFAKAFHGRTVIAALKQGRVIEVIN